MARPNFNLFPSCTGGYHFKDAQGRDHEGNNWPDLITKVRLFRQVNGQPVGDPEAEIYAQFCGAFPDYCGGSAAVPRGTVAKPASQFPMSVMNWLARVYTEHNRGKVPFADPAEALRRAEVCANCPRQQNWKTGCAGCNHNFHVLADDLLKGRPATETTNRLLGCNSLEEDTRVSIHLNQAPGRAPGQPDFCWRR